MLITRQNLKVINIISPIRPICPIRPIIPSPPLQTKQNHTSPGLLCQIPSISQ